MSEKREQTRGGIEAALARNTAAFRKRLGLSQETLAEDAGLSRKTIYNAETFGTAAPRTIEKLASVFGVPVTAMIEPDEESALAIFMGMQGDRLSPHAQDMFFRTVRKAAERTQQRSIDRALVCDAAQVLALFALPESRWYGKVHEDPRLLSEAAATEMLTQSESMNAVNGRVAVSRFRFTLRVIEEIRPEPPHELRALGWKGIAWNLRSLGDYSEALAALDAAERSAELCTDRKSMLARIKLTRAIVWTTMERWDESLDLVRESRRTFREIGDEMRAVMADEQEAIVLMKLGRAMSATRILKRLLREPADDATLARRYTNLAGALDLAGDIVAARRMLKKAIALHQKLGWKQRLTMDAWMLGRLQVKEGGVEKGLVLLARVSAKSRQLDDPDTAIRVDLDRCEIEIKHRLHTAETFDRLRSVATYATENGLADSERRARVLLSRPHPA